MYGTGKQMLTPVELDIITNEQSGLLSPLNHMAKNLVFLGQIYLVYSIYDCRCANKATYVFKLMKMIDLSSCSTIWPECLLLFVIKPDTVWLQIFVARYF